MASARSFGLKTFGSTTRRPSTFGRWSPANVILLGFHWNPAIVSLPIFSLIVLLATSAFGQATSQYELADLKALENAFTALAGNVQPSVVVIRTYKAYDPGHSDGVHVQIPLSQGSGFVIDSEGYIATNRHVIQESDIITVRPVGEPSYLATLVGS
ncbi:MAG: S1C family serine protease, partial [Planctomycetota bacterium]